MDLSVSKNALPYSTWYMPLFYSGVWAKTCCRSGLWNVIQQSAIFMYLDFLGRCITYSWFTLPSTYVFQNTIFCPVLVAWFRTKPTCMETVVPYDNTPYSCEWTGVRYVFRTLWGPHIQKTAVVQRPYKSRRGLILHPLVLKNIQCHWQASYTPITPIYTLPLSTSFLEKFWTSNSVVSYTALYKWSPIKCWPHELPMRDVAV